MFVFIIVAVFVLAGCAEETPDLERETLSPTDEEEPLEFELLPQRGDSAVKFELINGRKADREEFPGVFQRKDERRPCTASLVGPKTLFLAAHCFSRRQKTVKIGENEGKCEWPPGYSFPGDFQDVALCLLTEPITGVVYESLNIDEAPTTKTPVVLTGFGCTEENGKIDDELRIGLSVIIDRPASQPPNAPAIYAKGVAADGDPILCKGDSGGPLFHFVSGESGPRSIVGVNSANLSEFGASRFVSLAAPPISGFIRSWKDKFQQDICGTSGLVEGCK